MSDREKARLCAEWLGKCLSFGWSKADLTWLEKLWRDGEAWQYQRGGKDNA